MKVLMTGRGTSGSWQIRGVQLARAMGATAEPHARNVQGLDLAVLVKRPTDDLLQRLHGAKVPLIWDVVDAWPQPAGNAWNRTRCMEWLAGQVKAMRPAGIVAATRAMAQDCEGFGVPVLTLPHHARPGLKQNPIREDVKIVGYEGGEQYIGSWRPLVEAECLRRGWRFLVNPDELAEVDIVLALRDATGYAPRAWKSGVKAMNAKGSGTPCILNRESGYIEAATGGEYWADSIADLREAFDSLAGQEERRRAAIKLRAGTLTVEAAASIYKTWLETEFC
jgi:hypothetical protein